MRGSNHSGMRQFNERIVLQAIRHHGALPKADLARLTHLSTQTVANAVTRLMSDGLLLKQDRVRGRIGQPSVPLALNPEGAFSVGIQVGRRNLELTVVDFCGQRVAGRASDYDHPDPAHLFSLLEARLQSLRAELGERWARVVGVGLTAPLTLHLWGDLLGAGAAAALRRWEGVDLTAQVQALLAQLEAGQALPQEQRLAINDLLTLTTAAGAPPPAPHKTLPWLLRVEQLVFGPWQTPDDASVRCPACGSQQVGRKSATSRNKHYYDAQGQLQTVAVYRYYCRNPQCQQGSFTHLPPGLLPYSRYRSELHLLAVQMYAWGYSTYRRTGTALGVASLTAWRWVQAWGHDLLPVAALFGLVKSSGVVGVDEKYVLVPKNNKPDSAMRRWMYVYFAVDVWTYDLLHIAIYPHNDQASATAFLLALRTKGYHPDVIVTDLRQDYGSVINRVFPQATHHLCIFHALQDVQKHIKTVYGPNYAQTHPEANQLKQQIYRIFDADTITQATQRYDAVLALRPAYVQALPEASVIFDFLQRHWPKLANSIGSDTIPATNNTVELVIRRFDQHYQSFCGFESIHHAHSYLAVFEKVYRFTPFSPDAQPRIRNHCPLQLAGYDVSHLPMTTICAGLSILWPLQPSDTSHVPNL